MLGPYRGTYILSVARHAVTIMVLGGLGKHSGVYWAAVEVLEVSSHN